MHDEMSADAAQEKAAEEAAIKAFDALMSAKTKEVNALTKALEAKMTRVGELAVEIVPHTFRRPNFTNFPGYTKPKSRS